MQITPQTLSGLSKKGQDSSSPTVRGPAPSGSGGERLARLLPHYPPGASSRKNGSHALSGGRFVARLTPMSATTDAVTAG
jgi:hypothetical protein